MKILQHALIALVLLTPGRIMAQRANDSLALVNAEWNWKKIGKNAQAGYAMIPMFGITQSISVIKYKAKNYKTLECLFIAAMIYFILTFVGSRIISLLERRMNRERK